MLTALLKSWAKSRRRSCRSAFQVLDKIERRDRRRSRREAAGRGWSLTPAFSRSARISISKMSRHGMQVQPARARMPASIEAVNPLGQTIAALEAMGSRRIPGRRSHHRAGHRLLHRHRLRAVRCQGRAPRHLWRRPLRQPAEARSAASTSRRSDSAWETWCWASCSRTAGSSRRTAPDRRVRGRDQRGGSSPCAPARPRAARRGDAGRVLAGVPAGGKAAQAGRCPRMRGSPSSSAPTTGPGARCGEGSVGDEGAGGRSPPDPWSAELKRRINA